MKCLPIKGTLLFQTRNKKGNKKLPPLGVFHFCLLLVVLLLLFNGAVLPILVGNFKGPSLRCYPKWQELKCLLRGESEENIQQSSEIYELLVLMESDLCLWIHLLILQESAFCSLYFVYFLCRFCFAYFFLVISISCVFPGASAPYFCSNRLRRSSFSAQLTTVNNLHQF